MQSLWAECDISVSRVLPIFSRFRFRRFGLRSWDIGFGTFSLQKNFSISVKILVSSHSAFMGCFYWTQSLRGLFSALIGVTLVDEDADSKVVDVAADIEESIGNSFGTESLTTMFSMISFYDESK